MRRNNKGPNLDRYIVGREKRYARYEDAARLYSLPYYTFVKLAKEANANLRIRRTALVDLDAVENYILSHHEN